MIILDNVLHQFRNFLDGHSRNFFSAYARDTQIKRLFPNTLHSDWLIRFFSLWVYSVAEFYNGTKFPSMIFVLFYVWLARSKNCSLTDWFGNLLFNIIFILISRIYQKKNFQCMVVASNLQMDLLNPECCEIEFLADWQFRVWTALVILSVDLKASVISYVRVGNRGIQVVCHLLFAVWIQTPKKDSMYFLVERVLRNALGLQSLITFVWVSSQRKQTVQQKLYITLWGFRVKMVHVISGRKRMGKRLHWFFSPRNCLPFHQTNCNWSILTCSVISDLVLPII